MEREAGEIFVGRVWRWERYYTRVGLGHCRA